MNPTPLSIEKGDLRSGFDESDHVLEGEMRVGGQVGHRDKARRPFLRTL